MKTFLLLAVLLFAQAAHAQVGVGTDTPSANAVLDVTSDDKGLMLPRVNDTASIANPTAGLLIFNKATNALAFHNGTSWNSFGATTSTSTSATDSLTYESSGPGTSGITTGQFRAESVSISSGNSHPGIDEMSATFSKYPDVNSSAMQQAFLNATTQGTIEFFYYKQGSATPYKSVKFTIAKIVAFQFGLSDNGVSGNGVSSEYFTITFRSYGFKDWINNKSFKYDLSTKTISTY